MNARHIHSARRSSHLQTGAPSTTSRVTTTRRRRIHRCLGRRQPSDLPHRRRHRHDCAPGGRPHRPGRSGPSRFAEWVAPVPAQLRAPRASALLGDAGELLDAQAKDAYRRRLAELDDDIEQARATGDAERAAQADAERVFLVRELARAFGLSGRGRRAASASERARARVTRAVRQAIARIGEHHPNSASISTGPSGPARTAPILPVSTAAESWSVGDGRKLDSLIIRGWSPSVGL